MSNLGLIVDLRVCGKRIEANHKVSVELGLSDDEPVRPIWFEAADALEAMEWRLAETAPKDGTEIMVHRAGTKLICMAKWNGTHFFSLDWEVAITPTHWMPWRPPEAG